jgi:hypothetical protein
MILWRNFWRELEEHQEVQEVHGSFYRMVLFMFGIPIQILGLMWEIYKDPKDHQDQWDLRGYRDPRGSKDLWVHKEFRG